MASISFGTWGVSVADYISVLIVNQSLTEVGIIANTAFVLGLTAGRRMPEETFGPAVVDGDGHSHTYLTSIGHYVRKAGASKLRTLRDTFASMPDVTLVDYTEEAAPADYAAYTAALGAHRGDEINYRAIHIYGLAELIIPLTKNLSRM